MKVFCSIVFLKHQHLEEVFKYGNEKSLALDPVEIQKKLILASETVKSWVKNNFTFASISPNCAHQRIKLRLCFAICVSKT